jgi:hypothetical protein
MVFDFKAFQSSEEGREASNCYLNCAQYAYYTNGRNASFDTDEDWILERSWTQKGFGQKNRFPKTQRQEIVFGLANNRSLVQLQDRNPARDMKEVWKPPRCPTTNK